MSVLFLVYTPSLDNVDIPQTLIMIKSKCLLLLTFSITIIPWAGSISDIPPDFLADYLDNDPEELPDEYTNLSTNEEDVDSSGMVVDPQGSWLTFVKYSNRANGKKMRKTKSKKKKKRRILHGPPGPEGPQGPPGPAGAPGTVITKEAMMEEFTELVKEVAAKRAEELLAAKCQACHFVSNNSHIPTVPSEGVSETLAIPRITAGFHMGLRGNAGVSRKTFMELKNFYQPFGGGSFHRGEVFNARDGRFVAPRDGIYQFSVKLHILVKKKSQKIARLRRKDNITVLLCIQSLCQQYTSLKSVSGLDSNSKLFTVSLGGFLELKKDMYASVYVDNASAIDIIVTSGSEYSGILVGL